MKDSNGLFFLMVVVQLRSLVRSTDVWSTCLHGKFLAGPNIITLIVISNPDIRSARLYGQFSLDKTLTLQAGSTVFINHNWIIIFCLLDKNTHVTFLVG